MACIEHNCIDCGYFTMNNNWKETECPKCGSRMVRFFDEYMDHDDEYEDDEPNEDEEE